MEIRMPSGCLWILAAFSFALLGGGHGAFSPSIASYRVDGWVEGNGISFEKDTKEWDVCSSFQKGGVDRIGAAAEGAFAETAMECTELFIVPDSQDRGRRAPVWSVKAPAETQESKEFQRLTEQMGKLLKEMRRAGEEVREKIERDLLPRLREEMEKLREMLEKYRNEEEPEPVSI